MGIPYPFSAIVAQHDMKLALMLAAIEPQLGGVMVFGDRGTGKSTAVRGLASLLPPMPAVKGCRFQCDPASPAPECPSGCGRRGAKLVAINVPVPVVDLPLGATEDRVVGALDLEKALTRGEKAFEPGLLARAHRGFLYIDEVNLLEDHLVDMLLDVAASGSNIVEREGLSVRHPASFVLVGSGNPEEGELRPQLLDRFGLCVEVRTPADLTERVEVLRRRDAFERDPIAFSKVWNAENKKIAKSITAAKRRTKAVRIEDDILTLMSKLCAALGADGLRGELTLMRASRALAAMDGEQTVGAHHIRRIATMALSHRLRRDPLDETGSASRVARAITEVLAA